jgi:hypothetical protein
LGNSEQKIAPQWGDFFVQRVLKIDGPMGRRFLRLTTAARLRVKDCPAGNEYKYRLWAAVVGRIQKGRPLMTKPGSHPEGRWKYHTTSLVLE